MSKRANKSDQYTIISSSALPQITEVRLYDETLDHVVENHPEVPALLPSIIDAVKSAVASPSYVEKSSHSNSYVYVDTTSTNAGGDPLRVPVKGIEGTSGLVKTFFFASREVNGMVVWRKSDE